MKLKNRTVFMLFMVQAAMILIYYAMKFFGIQQEGLEAADIFIAFTLFWLFAVIILRESSIGHGGEKKGKDKQKQKQKGNSGGGEKFQDKRKSDVEDEDWGR